MTTIFSSDRYSTLQTAVESVIGSSTDERLKILDLTGERVFKCLRPNLEIEYFDYYQSIEKVWSELLPHALDWWKPLGLENNNAIELPELPGLEDILKLTVLARGIESVGNNKNLIVLLPPPLQALKILRMAHQGPDLINDILDPLLNWWDSTRGSLATVEKLLRLHLPSSAQLRLTTSWKERMKTLQRITSDRELHHLVLLFDGYNMSSETIKTRISTCGIHGVIPSHIIIESHAEKSHESLSSKDLNDLVDISFCESIVDTTPILNKKSNAELKISAPTTEYNIKSCELKVFLPYICKEKLTIKQHYDQIYFIYQGSRRTIPLPKSWASLTCTHAKISSGWLSLGFG